MACPPSARRSGGGLARGAGDAKIGGMATPETYSAACQNCGSTFDALDTPWCSCLVTERTLVCPHCLQCFCKAPASYKGRFWSAAPRALWDRKFKEHNEAFTPPVNPDPAEVERPLVLVVDDEKDIQRVAARVIQSLGYGLLLAHNGEEGLELARRYRPELVLTDALMPRMDGREMARRIKQEAAPGATKVVVMTALYTNVKYRTEGFKTYKVDDYLAKPLAFEDLRAVLQKHLG
jgi:CheY-like chemotaxis protein